MNQDEDRKKTMGEQIVAAFQFIDEPDRSFRALAVFIDAAITAAREAQREVDAKIEFAKIIPVDQGWTVSIGSLGIKLYGAEIAAREVCSAINTNIAAAIREGRG